MPAFLIRARNAGLGLLIAAFLGGLFTGDSRIAAVLLFVSGLGWIACARAHAERSPRPALLWSVALVLRLAALAAGPRFSDDVQRYAWEGEVVLDGKSPYAFAPDAPELAALRARMPELAARVNHPEVPAVYPPLAQLCGIATASLVHATGLEPGRASVWILRAIYLAADLGVLLLLLRAAAASRVHPSAAVIWGWCPLVCLEFAGSGHLDSLGILFLLLALLASDARRPGAALWAGLGAAVKFVPLCALPWIGRTLAPSRRWLGVGLALALLALGYLPFLWLEGGARGFGSGLREYGERWESASLVYRWVEPRVLEHLGAGVPFEAVRHEARLIVAVAWLALAGWAVWKRREACSGAGALVGAFLVLSPTLHPWYTLWMLPFLAQRPSLAWSWLVAGSALFYWPAGAWTWWVVAPVFVALWIAERSREAAT